jgi:hypothetical protein
MIGNATVIQRERLLLDCFPRLPNGDPVTNWLMRLSAHEVVNGLTQRTEWLYGCTAWELDVRMPPQFNPCWFDLPVALAVALAVALVLAS